MRYYHICYRGNTEDIKNDEEIERIIGRGYGTVLLRMNDYLWKNTKNGIEFLFYHEEANLLKAIFAYDEQSYSFDIDPTNDWHEIDGVEGTSNYIWQEL